ncbi:MAG: dihydrodipicolinate synthase family protein [Deltaproteobacteria bacterium]|nr:dihydrodipicolinate synthase family protein [Deltaproteobacteria bacterium]
MNLKLAGILCANITPFKENYDLDQAVLRRLIRYLAKSGGINAYVCNAGAGEGATLTRDERVRCIEIIREEDNRTPVVAGIEALSTREAIEQIRDAKRAGAAAVMLTPPHVYDWSAATNPEFAVQYFHDIAKAVEIPITIFHYPASTPSGYTPETAVRIAREVDSVIAIKVASGANIRRYEQVLRGMRALPRHISVLATSSLFQHFLTGADGALTGFANFAPEFCIDLFNAVKAGDLEKARKLHEINYALEAAIYKAPNVYKHSRYKVAAYFTGLLDNLIVRPPQVPIPEAEIRLIRDALEKLGWLRR